MLIVLFLVSHFNFLFVPCGGLSWLPVSFLLHVKYTLSYRIVSYPPDLFPGFGSEFRKTSHCLLLQRTALIPHFRHSLINPLMGTGNYSATSNNMKLVHRPFSPPRPLLAIPNVTVRPSTASVPITVLLYNGTLLCGFNVPVKGFRQTPDPSDMHRLL